MEINALITHPLLIVFIFIAIVRYRPDDRTRHGWALAQAAAPV